MQVLRVRGEYLDTRRHNARAALVIIAAAGAIGVGAFWAAFA